MPKLESLVLSLDTETTGLDLHHGALPFFVTFSGHDLEPQYVEWYVDPITRAPIVPEDDLLQVKELIESADTLILHNASFDYKALQALFDLKGIELKWDWGKVHDTLKASHILASSMPHDLTSLGIQYLGKNIGPFEEQLKEACQKARSICRSKAFKQKHGEWRIAKQGLPEMPSAKQESAEKGANGLPKSSPWAFDMWLPRAIAKAEDYDESHLWWTILSDYSNMDSTTTILLWDRLERSLKERGYWKIYQDKMATMPYLVGMETKGMSICQNRTEELKTQFEQEAEDCKNLCVNIADGKIEKLPVQGRSKALDNVIFNTFGLKSSKFTKKGNESMDASVLEEWLLTIDNRQPAWHFIKNLLLYRKRKTALSFIESYQKYWIDGHGSIKTIHSSINATGTATTRYSSSNPNGQQISKKKISMVDGEGSSGRTARYMFGPADGREWRPMDYENIELRIPAYKADEKSLIELFEKSNEPPFYGSEHLLNFSIMYEDVWEDAVKRVGIEKAGPWCKETYKSTWYQYCKNTDFALAYNCGEATCDRTSRRPGTYKKLKTKFARKESLNQKMIDTANKLGYIETAQGYPLVCQRAAYGKAKPTIPLSYYVQGTAGGCMNDAIVACGQRLDEWRQEGFDAYVIATIHDELIFDFPAGGKANNWRAEELAGLMCKSGDRIGVPLKVSIAYCPNNWGEEVKI